MQFISTFVIVHLIRSYLISSDLVSSHLCTQIFRVKRQQYILNGSTSVCVIFHLSFILRRTQRQYLQVPSVNIQVYIRIFEYVYVYAVDLCLLAARMRDISA